MPHRTSFDIKKLNSNKGVSLIEIVLSVAILGILTVSFFSVFSSSLTGIASSGGRTKAMTEASSKMEQAYTLSVSDFASEEEMESKLGLDVVDNTAELHQYTAGTDIKCIREAKALSEESGYIVTITVFFDNGKNYAEISSFVKV